jgi:hypothetical protein
MGEGSSSAVILSWLGAGHGRYHGTVLARTQAASAAAAPLLPRVLGYQLVLQAART